MWKKREKTKQHIWHDLTSRELGLTFQNTKKLICLFLISRIKNLYVKCILDIKRNKKQKLYFDSIITRLDP
jgi:hypothetical protein